MSEAWKLIGYINFAITMYITTHRMATNCSSPKSNSIAFARFSRFLNCSFESKLENELVHRRSLSIRLHGTPFIHSKPTSSSSRPTHPLTYFVYILAKSSTACSSVSQAATSMVCLAFMAACITAWCDLRASA